MDAGTETRTLLELQTSAGNRAVTRAVTSVGVGAKGPRSASLAAINSAAALRPGLALFPIPIDVEAIIVGLGAVRSSAAAAPGGAQQIRGEQGGGTRAAGYTSLPAPRPPELTTSEPEQRDGGWVARVQSTTVGADTPASLYPAPGVHDLGPGPTGQQRHIDVTPDMSEVIREGEQEHLIDLEWARHLSYDRAASAVNTAAQSEPPIGRTAAEARRLAERQVCAAMPRQLRWPLGTDPVRPWVRAYSRLAHVTIERDENGWHNMTSAFVLDPAEKRQLGVPEADELTRYRGGPQIGKHPSAPLVRGRFAELAE